MILAPHPSGFAMGLFCCAFPFIYAIQQNRPSDTQKSAQEHVFSSGFQLPALLLNLTWIILVLFPRFYVLFGIFSWGHMHAVFTDLNLIFFMSSCLVFVPMSFLAIFNFRWNILSPALSKPLYPHCNPLANSFYSHQKRFWHRFYFY